MGLVQLTARKQAEEPAAPSLEGLALQVAEAAAFTRKHAIAAIYHAGSGHPGGAMSSADVLAALFGAELNMWPDNLDDPHRDRFVLSKGHGAPALYAVASHFGFCSPKSALRLRKLGSPFQGHPHVLDLPWVETSTGSLGQGISVALGMAMGLKLQKSQARVYTLLGDGELQEGEVWEAAMCAAHHKLDNLCAIIDYNKLQSDDRNDNIMRLEPLAAKWRAFDWAVAEVDGHDIPEILRHLPPRRGQPWPAVGHHRPHREGQGRALYGKHPHLARQREADARTGRRRAQGARRSNRQEIQEFLDDSHG